MEYKSLTANFCNQVKTMKSYQDRMYNNTDANKCMIFRIRNDYLIKSFDRKV